jgi:hypothetical protein
MGEYAPQALVDLGKKIAKAIPGATFSGVLGDADHGYGYHRARAVLESSDYSVTLPADKQGDAWAASAVDVSFSPTSQKLVTQRMIDAVKRKDPRLKAVREFFGSIDGQTVTGRDVPSGRTVSSDDSHLWHVHWSILRKFSNDAAALAGVFEIATGADMAIDKDDIKKIFKTDGILNAPKTWKETNPDQDPYWTLETYMMSIRDNIVFVLRKQKEQDAKIDALTTKLNELTKLKPVQLPGQLFDLSSHVRHGLVYVDAAPAGR